MRQGVQEQGRGVWCGGRLYSVGMAHAICEDGEIAHYYFRVVHSRNRSGAGGMNDRESIPVAFVSAAGDNGLGRERVSGAESVFRPESDLERMDGCGDRFPGSCNAWLPRGGDLE